MLYAATALFVFGCISTIYIVNNYDNSYLAGKMNNDQKNVVVHFALLFFGLCFFFDLVLDIVTLFIADPVENISAYILANFGIISPLALAVSPIFGPDIQI